LVATQLHGATIVSSFNAGLDGWTATNGTFDFYPGGGGGALHVTSPPEPAADAIASAKFLGDLRSCDSGALEFDLDWFQGSGDYNPTLQYVKVTIAGPQDSASYTITHPPSRVFWNRYRINLRASTWGRTQDDWRALLANVTSSRVRVDVVVGEDGYLLDDITLATPPTLTVSSSGTNAPNLSWDSRTNTMYQLQYASDVGTNEWTNLGLPVAGTGTNAVTDTVDSSRRFDRNSRYQLNDCHRIHAA
jgi:hypothetical protein